MKNPQFPGLTKLWLSVMSYAPLGALWLYAAWHSYLNVIALGVLTSVSVGLAVRLNLQLPTVITEVVGKSLGGVCVLAIYNTCATWLGTHTLMPMRHADCSTLYWVAVGAVVFAAFIGGKKALLFGCQCAPTAFLQYFTVLLVREDWSHWATALMLVAALVCGWLAIHFAKDENGEPITSWERAWLIAPGSGNLPRSLAVAVVFDLNPVQLGVVILINVGINLTSGWRYPEKSHQLFDDILLPRALCASVGTIIFAPNLFNLAMLAFFTVCNFVKIFKK